MKKMPLLLLFLSLMVLSCKKDEMILHEETKTEPTLSIQEAQNSFNPEKFTTSLDGSSNCNLLPKMQITPEWSKSKQYQFAKYSVVETPLLWNNQKLGKLRQVDSKTDRGKKKAEEVEIVTNLISVKDSTWKITRKIMVISGEPDYLKNNKITNNNYKQKDPKFTGEVIYYNEDGSFNSGWRFKNGRVVKKIMNIICDDNSVGLRNYEYRCDLIRECTHWFQIGYGGEVSYLGSSCSYTTECDWYPISEDQNPEEDGTSGGGNVEPDDVPELVVDGLINDLWTDIYAPYIETYWGRMNRLVWMYGLNCKTGAHGEYNGQHVYNQLKIGVTCETADDSQPAPMEAIPITKVINGNTKIVGHSFPMNWYGAYNVTWSQSASLQIEVGAKAIGFSVGGIFSRNIGFADHRSKVVSCL